MPIWKLEPIDLTSRDWDASTYKGTVIVRAQNEKEARILATQSYAIAAARQLGEKTPINPWSQGELVSCNRLEDSEYEEKGPSKILSPKSI